MFREKRVYIDVFTYLLTMSRRVLIENVSFSKVKCSCKSCPSLKTYRFQLVKKFPIFYGTRMFITAFKCSRHLSLSWASSIQSITSHSISWRTILILSSHLHLVLPNGIFPSGFPNKTPYTPLLSPKRAICPAHHILLDFITRKIVVEGYRSLSSSLCSFIHFLVTPSLLGPNILLNTVFSNALSLCSSLSVSDQVSHSRKKGKIVVLYILISYFWTANWKKEGSVPNDSKHSLTSICSYFLLNKILICYGCSQIFELSTVSKELLSVITLWLPPAFYRFKGTTISHYTVTSSCILISRHDHVLSFFSLYH